MNKTFHSYLTDIHNNNFQLKNINEEITMSIIDKLTPKTSCGFDGISSKMIKIIKTTLIKPITLIINQMLTIGIFPDKLKIAKIIPIHKKDKDTLFTNYRPISLLPSLSIDHKILSEKLKYYGIIGVAYRRMQSYITHIQQYVDIDDVHSEMLTVTTGMPQGSMLGPLLYIIYLNDISNTSNLINFIIYANDTTLSTTIEVILNNINNDDVESKINSEIACINDWLRCSKLSLNISKCKYMIFH